METLKSLFFTCTFIQVACTGFSLPFRVTVSSMNGLREPTRFKTGTWNGRKI